MKYHVAIICVLGFLSLKGSPCCRRQVRPDIESGGRIQRVASATALVPMATTSLGSKKNRRVCHVGTAFNAATSAVISAVTYGLAAFVDYAVTSGTLADPQAASTALLVRNALYALTGLAGAKAAVQVTVSLPCVSERVPSCGERCLVRLKGG